MIQIFRHVIGIYDKSVFPNFLYGPLFTHTPHNCSALPLHSLVYFSYSSVKKALVGNNCAKFVLSNINWLNNCRTRG